MINVFQPTLGEEELEALREVFKSNWIGRGKQTDLFEAEFAHSIGAQRSQLRSIACCTEGLFQTMKLIELQKGDEVILPTISFVGAANAIIDAGGIPIFADVDSQTLNITAAEIEKKCSSKTKAVILLHFTHPCDLDEILSVCKSKNIALIEDNACSPVSTYKGQRTGTFGDYGLWSFDAMKVLVTGDGGMVYCKDPDQAAILERNIYLGLVSKSGYFNINHNRWWAFEIDQPGRRAIMNDISSAIGRVQLKKLDSFIQKREQVHAFYHAHLAQIEGIQLPIPLASGCTQSYYFYRIRLESADLRDELALHLKNAGVYTTFRYYPLHLVEFYGCEPKSCPNANFAAQHDLCLPIHQGLTDQDVEKVVLQIQAFFSSYARSVC